MSYAKNTTVSVLQSKNELNRLLEKYGVTKQGIDSENNCIFFTLHGRNVKISISIPQKNEFEYTETKRRRTKIQAEKAYEQAVRQRWRSLILILKAKFESIESGITIMENEFLPYFIRNDGLTVGEYMQPQLNNPNIFPALPEKID